MVSFFAGVKFFIKPWTIVHGFIFESSKKVVRKVYRFKENENRSLTTLVSIA